MSSNPFKIHRAAHTGFTVSSLSASLAFWHDLLGLPIVYRRSLDMGPEPNTIGVANAKVNAVLLELPGGHQVELLEYSSPDDRVEMKPRPCDVGNVHLAISVTGSKEIIKEAEKLGWVPAAAEPPRMQRGDGTWWGIVYLRSPEGVSVELLEKLEG